MSSYILAIDQGTTSTGVFLIDENLDIKAGARREIVQHYPKPGLVEHDAEDIWQSVLQTMGRVIAESGVAPGQIAAIGITNQRETCLLWDRKTSKPLMNAIVWQDRRTSLRCAELKRRGLERIVNRKTGLVCDPYFSGTKLEWMLKNVPGAGTKAKNGDLAFGTIDSFLVWKLTSGKTHATDATNASRTLLLNIEKLSWDPELLKLFRVPNAILPRVVSSSEKYGVTRSVPGLTDGIPVCAIVGDQQSALVGQACFRPGEAKCTYGTGSFILLNIGNKLKLAKNGILTTVAYQVRDEVSYAWEGSAFIAGAAVQWLRDGLKMIQSSSDVEALAREVPDSGGVTFVPALAGLGAPHWRPDARGILAGITRGTKAAHIARATLEGIAFCQYDILQSMTKNLGRRLKILKVDGGASENDLLMQFQSDILRVPISRPAMTEVTALGAAFLAGLSAGFWKDMNDIHKRWREEKRFTPEMPQTEVRKNIKRWRNVVKKA